MTNRVVTGFAVDDLPGAELPLHDLRGDEECGVGIAFAVVAFVISDFFIGVDKFVAFMSIIGTLIVFLPIILRLSRNIWINLFIKYDKGLAKK